MASWYRPPDSKVDELELFKNQPEKVKTLHNVKFKAWRLNATIHALMYHFKKNVLPLLYLFSLLCRGSDFPSLIFTVPILIIFRGGSDQNGRYTKETCDCW